MAQKVGSAQASYHLLDTHSDVVGLVSTAAANQGTTSYDAYGGVLGTTGTQGILGYQGDTTDAATKQVDMGTRWYAPGQGRFTSRDVLFGELSSPMTLNQFAYAGGNPITMWDPTGMRPTCRPDCSSDEEQELTDWYSETVTSNGGYSTPYDPSPPQPQPAPAITYVREAGHYVDSVLDLAGALVDGAEHTANLEATVLRGAAGAGFLDRNAATELWLAKAARYSRLARLARGAGVLGLGVGAINDYAHFTSHGDGRLMAAIKTAEVAGASGVAGTYGAILGLALCGPPCALVGAGIGGIGGAWIVSNVLTDPASGVMADDPRHSNAYPVPDCSGAMMTCI